MEIDGVGKSNGSDLFSQLGLEVVQGSVEIGRTYPVFGAITRFIDDTPGRVVAELNYSMHMLMNVPDMQKLDILKEHAFDSGIFVAKVIAKEPVIQLECQTVIFGKKQGYHA